MSKDAFQEFVDELTALRRSVEHLARTSLDKQEAETLHQIVVNAATRMERTTQEAHQSPERRDAAQAGCSLV